MLTCINVVLEMLATMICLNHLFCKKYYFKIHDAVFLLSEVIIFEIANYLRLSKGVALFGYAGIYIYELTKFKCSIRKANVNLVLVMIFCVFAQVICSIPTLMLAEFVHMDLLVTFVNCLMMGIFLFFGKRGYFYKVSRGILGYDMLNNIAAGVCFVGAAYLLIVYKMEEYLRLTDYIIFGVWTILLGVLIISWQREKFDKIAKEKEIELRTAYDTVYEQLLESIRRKQHDFHNQITAIYSHHLMAKDYDTLVSLQKKYCDQILEENRYARLLSGNSPMVIAFLYSKFIEAESKGCHIQYDIKVDKLQCRIPQYKMIEILGVLFDNAVEAVEEHESKNICVEILEMMDLIQIMVKNDSRYFEEYELRQFLEPGYSTKGTGRGTGLAKVKEILLDYDCQLDIYCERGDTEMIVFAFEITKKL